MTIAETLHTSLLGRYEILREIGSGGMATVYLAHDVRHDRQVALKVLRPELGAVLGVERFLSEIRVTANLQHPHLLPLFDSGEAEGLLFYVMPYVRGESLRARLEREGQLGIEEAVRIASAVASALDYAHRNNVIHRDLKPENILLQDGQPVVSDFGIALAVRNAGGARVTQTGLSLGTPSYMSPEQAAGDRVIDARSDVYSLGAVTYEMLVGEPPHTGANVQQVISRMLVEQPRPISVHRPTVPVHLEEAILRALAKLPADRFASAREFADAMNAAPLRALVTSGARKTVVTPAAVTRSRWTSLLPWSVAAVAALGALGAWKRPSRTPALPPVVRFNFSPPDGLRSPMADLAISADGSTLLLSEGGAGKPHVWIRSLNEDAVTELPKLAGAHALMLAPNGKSIAWIDDGKLRVMPLSGESSTVIATVGDGPPGESGTWGTKGSIVLARPDSGGLWSVSADGGAMHRVTQPSAEQGEMDVAPSFLPDGVHFLFERHTRGTNDGELMVGATNGAARALNVKGKSPKYSGGLLTYASADGTINGVAFDSASFEVSGRPTQLLSLTSPMRGPFGARYVASFGGVLAFVESAPRRSELVMVDRQGKVTPVVTTARNYEGPSVAPDGKSVAVEVTDSEGNTDIWVYDLAGTSRRITRGGRNRFPIWSPRGDRLVWSASTTDGASNLMMQPTDGSSGASVVLSGSGSLHPMSFSPNGDSVRVSTMDERRQSRLVSRSLSDGGMRDFVTVQGERGGSLSPDGKWFLYTGTEESRAEVFVRPSRSESPVTRLSDAGGDRPRWGPGGRTVIYRDSSAMVELALDFAPAVRVTSRQRLFAGAFDWIGTSEFDVAPDGRFVMLRSETPASHVDVIVNVAGMVRGRR